MIALEVTNNVLRAAIELRMSDVFPAMNIANALGGLQTDVWKIVRQYGLDELIAEALDRGLPVDEFKSAVEHKKFTDCKCYLRVRDIIGGRHDFPL